MNTGLSPNNLRMLKFVFLPLHSLETNSRPFQGATQPRWARGIPYRTWDCCIRGRWTIYVITSSCFGSWMTQILDGIFLNNFRLISIQQQVCTHCHLDLQCNVQYDDIYHNNFQTTIQSTNIMLKTA